MSASIVTRLALSSRAQGQLILVTSPEGEVLATSSCVSPLACLAVVHAVDDGACRAVDLTAQLGGERPAEWLAVLGLRERHLDDQNELVRGELMNDDGVNFSDAALDAIGHGLALEPADRPIQLVGRVEERRHGAWFRSLVLPCHHVLPGALVNRTFL